MERKHGKGSGERETRSWGSRTLSRDAGRVSSRRNCTVMISERVKRVLGSIGSRERFLITVFLLSAFTASVWSDNTTSSGEWMHLLISYVRRSGGKY